MKTKIAGWYAFLMLAATASCSPFNSNINKYFNKASSFNYVPEKFNHWQTVKETDAKKAGDCEDMALWLYYHLKKEGYKIRFVVGEIYQNGKKFSHAWTELDYKKKTYIIDPTHYNYFAKDSLFDNGYNEYSGLIKKIFEMKLKEWERKNE